MEREDTTFGGDENEMTTESGYNHLFITSSISSVDSIALSSDTSSSGHHHSNHVHQQHSSNMYFHTNFGDTFFFKPFTTSSNIETFYVCIVLFLLAILYNLLKSYQFHLNQKRPSFEETCYPVAEKFSEAESIGNGNNSHTIKSWIKSLLSMHNALDTIIHVVVVTIGYLLMLAVMSFNLWILFAVVSGEGIGYFIFGFARRVPIADDVSQGENSCCFIKTTSSGDFNNKEPK